MAHSTSRALALVPTSVVNFVEGTRFTEAKHAQQNSPFRYLLKPKAGGMAVALATMGEDFDALLDVTIAYPRGTPRFWDLLAGRVQAVTVRVTDGGTPALFAERSFHLTVTEANDAPALCSMPWSTGRIDR
mgnify:CR=1 FL=1